MTEDPSNDLCSELEELDSAYRRIARDLDILLIDATMPFGLGHLLPRGFLREPISNMARADLFMGVGPQAGERAGRLRSRGRLYLFLLKGEDGS